jgi:nifR3 family TIM-barrel protein
MPDVRPLRIGPVVVDPPVLLAPMAGETGSVLRILCRREGAGMVCTELTSSHGLYFGNPRSLEYLRWTDEERPISAQIFGAEPEMMAEAARRCCLAGADIIDINMGCWVPKVAKTGAGAAMLRDVGRARAVMEAVVEASSVPVTVKTRVGWDGCTGSALEIGQAAQEAGVRALTIHGRTAVQGFSGQADWRPIAEAKGSLAIPVIGNGDVGTPEDVRRMFQETGCDAVMVGRAALGNPWIFREIARALRTGSAGPPPTSRERLETVREHARLLALQHGGSDAPEARLPGVARGQLSHYLVGMPGSAEARRLISRVETLSDVDAVLAGLACAAPPGAGAGRIAA